MQLSHALPEALRESRAVEVLERSLDQNRLGHGILLHGESLAGLETIVRAIAARLLETENDPYKHPDCFTLRPSGKARMIRVGDSDEANTMRQLVINVQKSSNQGGRKVGIIFDADRMNPASANAFLKTLEEPPEGTTLFLLTARPYDLLDTIRSRCLNFRIPVELESIAHTDWAQWLKDYREWLRRLIEGPTKQSIPHIVMGAYGLNCRFQHISDELSAEEWEQAKSTLPEHLSDKDVDAAKTGVFKTFRGQLLGEIERATANFARELETANPGRLPAAALNRAIESLEKTAGLLELNFNQAAALERFFLTSLRIWTAAR